MIIKNSPILSYNNDYLIFIRLNMFLYGILVLTICSKFCGQRLTTFPFNVSLSPYYKISVINLRMHDSLISYIVFIFLNNKTQ